MTSLSSRSGIEVNCKAFRKYIL